MNLRGLSYGLIEHTTSPKLFIFIMLGYNFFIVLTYMYIIDLRFKWMQVDVVDFDNAKRLLRPD